MLNHIVLMGRLTRDPELRYTQSNTPVASFTLAVERDIADKTSGQRQTDFIDCVAWSKTGEFVSKYFAKGNMTAVSGRLQIRDWTDRDNNKRRSAEVVVDNVYFCESKKSRENQAPGAASGTYSAPAGYNEAAKGGSAFAELDDGDGELPF
jgi:single-strand DNA-binding protein